MQVSPARGRASVVRRVEVAFVSVGAATGLSLLLLRWIEFPTWFPLLLAGIASAWVGGRVAGWTAVILSTLSYDFFFTRPRYSFTIEPDDLPYFIAFTISMLLGNWFGTWRKSTDTALQQARDALAVQVQEGGVELEKVSEALRAEASGREQAEHERRVAELRWRAVFDNSAVGMALAGEDGRIIASNSHYQRLAERQPGAPSGAGLEQFLPEAQRSDFGARLAELLDGRRQRIDMEVQRQAVDGVAVWLRMHIALVAATPEFPRFLIAFCEDASERRRTEEALLTARSNLAHAARLTTIGELTASIAHELNQPLAAIVTNGNACLRWLAGDAPNLREAGNTLNWIMRDARRASDVIARIRALMRKAAPHWETVNLNDVVREGLEMVQGELGRRKVEITTELDPQLPAIHGERVQLQQLFINLALNAVEAMATVTTRPRRLRIRSARQAQDGDGVELEVSDNGPGVDAADLDKLFSAFFTTKAQGTGLGLWICQSIAESHSGRLLAQCNAEHGMCFRLLLPREQLPADDARSIAGEDFTL